MNAKEIVADLSKQGSDSYKKVMAKHGTREPFFGVKIEYLKKIQKRVKTDYKLALDLYDTGIYDAMYLAGLIADDTKMTKKDLKGWIEKAHSLGLYEYTVPWVAAGSPHGWELGLEWIESPKESVAVAGWQTLGGVLSMKEDSDLDLDRIRKLLERVETTIHDQPNRVRYVMNSFVISVGASIKSLTERALRAAAKIGKVSVDMGDTSCKVPDAAVYIEKIRKRGAIGKKRKTIKC